TDGFYEFRFSDPETDRDEAGTASIAWPGVAVHRGRLGELPITVIHGHEPGLKWREFLSLVLAQLGREDSVVLLGGLHAEVPHTRPLPVVANTEDRELAGELDIDANAYEGPIGILGLLAVSCQWRGLRSINLWVGVPDYLADSPSPKAELALVKAVERFTGVEIDIHVLEEESRAWELGADELVSFNPHLAELVKGLEKQNDPADLPEASGDAIAAEFERYLRKRGREKCPEGLESVAEADAQQRIDRVGDPVAADGVGVRGLGVGIVLGPFVEDAQGPRSVEVVGQCLPEQADDVSAQPLTAFRFAAGGMTPGIQPCFGRFELVLGEAPIAAVVVGQDHGADDHGIDSALAQL